MATFETMEVVDMRAWSECEQLNHATMSLQACNTDCSVSSTSPVKPHFSFHQLSTLLDFGQCIIRVPKSSTVHFQQLWKNVELLIPSNVYTKRWFTLFPLTAPTYFHILIGLPHWSNLTVIKCFIALWLKYDLCDWGCHGCSHSLK